MGVNKYKKLAKNSLVFLVGNLGSKIIALIIVPFYTHVLTTAEYGTADLLTTTIGLVMPFAILGLNEATLRFGASREFSTKIIATNSMIIVLAGVAISWTLYPLISSFSVIGEYSALFLVLLNLTCFTNVFMQLMRGLGMSKQFALNGVISTFVMASSNVLVLAVLHLGVAGYLLSMVLAQLVSAVYITFSCRLWRLICREGIDGARMKEMLAYSLPLVPNQLMWWVMSASDRYIIIFFVGAGANGIYSVAHKLPTIVNTLYSVFTQAWQISAIEERASEDNADFQSVVFRHMFAALAIATSLIAASAYPVYALLMSASYRDSWAPVALLALANLFSCIGAFFGVTYVVTKETKRAFSTTMWGAAANLALTALLVPAFGIMGAALATSASYAVVSLIRARDTRSYVSIEYDKPLIAKCFGIIGAQTALSFLRPSLGVVSSSFVLSLILIFVLRSDVGTLLSMGRKMLAKKDKR